RVPGGGSWESGVELRIVMYVAPPFAGSVKRPAKVAPACSMIVSPGWAALIAACRSPPAFTVRVAADADVVHPSTHAHRATTDRVTHTSFRESVVCVLCRQEQFP